MPTPKVHSQAFWIFGVIVGLSIEEAVKTTVPHITQSIISEDGRLQAVRLFVFIVTVVRFYLGASEYFAQVYEAADSEANFPRRNYTWDLLCGMSHFTLFTFLALSIGPAEGRWEWIFYSFLISVLLYDILWWALSWKLSTKHKIGKWAVLNAVTVAFSVVVAFAGYYGCQAVFGAPDKLPEWQRQCAEIAAYVPVLILSAFDYAALIRGRSWLEDQLAGIFSGGTSSRA